MGKNDSLVDSKDLKGIKIYQGMQKQWPEIGNWKEVGCPEKYTLTKKKCLICLKSFQIPYCLCGRDTTVANAQIRMYKIPEFNPCFPSYL